FLFLGRKSRNCLSHSPHSHPRNSDRYEDELPSLPASFESVGCLGFTSVGLSEERDPGFPEDTETTRMHQRPTRALLAEAFSKTPDYFQALRCFCDNLRLTRQQPDHID
ncbi:MAG: hypothetical protein ACREAC_21860, partial [Blastocatellia bacterium]